MPGGESSLDNPATPGFGVRDMKLRVLDLDGTLTRTNAVDEECFVKAFADVFGIQDVNTEQSARFKWHAAR